MASAGQRPEPTRTGLVFGLLASVQITLIATITLVLVAMPAIKAELGLTDGELALISSGYGLTFAGLLLLGGRVSDMFGTRRTFVFATVLFGLASLVAAAAPSFPFLLGARLAQGATAAFVAPSAMSLVNSLYSQPQRRRRALALWGGLSGLGATAGTLLSGVVVTAVSWRWIFIAPASVALITAFIIRSLAPTNPAHERNRLDVTGAVLVTAGLSAVSYGLLTGTEESFSAHNLIPLFGGGVLLIFFALVQARTREPLVPGELLRSRVRVLGVVGIFITAAIMSTSLFILSLHLQRTVELNPLSTSVVFIPFGLLQLGTGSLASRLIHRIGARSVSTAGLVIAGVGLASLSRLSTSGGLGLAILFGLPILAIGVALSFAANMLLAVESARPQHSGIASGLANTAMEVGPTLGLAILISLASAHSLTLRDNGVAPNEAGVYGYQLAFLVAAIATVIVAVLIGLFASTSGKKENETTMEGIRHEHAIH